ncbi:ankyrin repeat domain-containing protein [Legionella rowbothamii]|uniref:ankyrin repeat domain-containing protein n=1 Tax=Legionella rowbothamii TaxID=96229 RepID=UPI0010555EDC|nr:ankyrin repeat domain-containing protein [Legionella rowbothamii]
MKKYIDQLHHAMENVRQRLKTENLGARKALAVVAKKETQIFEEELGERIAHGQKIEAARIRTALAQRDSVDPIHKQKAALLKTINNVGHSLTRIYFDLFVSSLSLKEGFNGCMEHASLMFLILNKEFLFDPDVLIESMAVQDKINPTINHNFLVINRCIGDYPLTDIASWGDECLVVDTWLGVIAVPVEMPQGSSVHAFLHGQDSCTMDVIYTNRLGMELCVYSKGHLFHQIERDTKRLLQAEFKKIIDKYTGTLDLPWFKLTSPASTTTASSHALSKHGLFPSARSVDMNEQLCSEIKHLCTEKYQNVLEVIQCSQYALALRKVSAIGHIELVSILLRYKDVLGFDINEPSKSNGKTALDWAVAHGSAETIALIEKHGGKSGSVENDVPSLSKRV